MRTNKHKHPMEDLIRLRYATPATVLPGGVLQPLYRENFGEAHQQLQLKFNVRTHKFFVSCGLLPTPCYVHCNFRAGTDSKTFNMQHKVLIYTKVHCVTYGCEPMHN